MKNQIKSIGHEGQAELQAKKAIQLIYKRIEDQHPRLAAIAKSRLIVECLIELAEERKFLSRN
ncbi:MAG: hypothetical protein ACJ748_08300 [Flavisolibacter sp.]